MTSIAMHYGTLFLIVTIARPRAGRKVTSHVSRNPEFPARLEALQHEPERALSARRPRIGRHRYHPVGHPADRVGHRPARKILTPEAPAPCGRFCFEPQKPRSRFNPDWFRFRQARFATPKTGRDNLVP